MKEQLRNELLNAITTELEVEDVRKIANIIDIVMYKYTVKLDSNEIIEYSNLNSTHLGRYVLSQGFTLNNLACFKATTTETSFNILDGRKISDYEYIGLCPVIGSALRNPYLIPVSLLVDRSLYITHLVSGDLGYIFIRYIDDTHIAITTDSVTSNEAQNNNAGLHVYGVKITI